jgi:hypothetical protein
MAVATLLVSELTQRRLGDDGLAELAACLRAVDCQSCGRLPGADLPSVCVDDLGGAAVASLHHQRCRPPGWNESMTVVAGSGLYSTFVARMILVPVTSDSGAKHVWPLMVVNPGLECVHLQRGAGGRWQVSPDRWRAGWLAEAIAAADRLAAGGMRISRRNLRAGGVRASNTSLGALAVTLNNRQPATGPGGLGAPT